MSNLINVHAIREDGTVYLASFPVEDVMGVLADAGQNVTKIVLTGGSRIRVEETSNEVVAQIHSARRYSEHPAKRGISAETSMLVLLGVIVVTLSLLYVIARAIFGK